MKNKIEKVVGMTLFLFLFPFFSSAASLADIANKLLVPIRVIPKFLFALALVYFLFGVSKYVTAIDEKKLKEARDTIGYGLLGLFVMTSMWGIVNMIRRMLGI